MTQSLLDETGILTELLGTEVYIANRVLLNGFAFRKDSISEMCGEEADVSHK